MKRVLNSKLGKKKKKTRSENVCAYFSPKTTKKKRIREVCVASSSTAVDMHIAKAHEERTENTKKGHSRI